MKVISGLIGVFLVMPIWFYLLYQILTRVNATELMWFLFYVYIPFGLLVNFSTIYFSNKEKN